MARQADIVVAGGGPAGLAAAVASARNGARTVLVERFGYLGGTATASLMACVNGFRNQVEPDDTQTVRGIAEEIVLELKDIDGLGTSPYPQKSYPTEPGRLEYSYAIDTEKFKYVALRMCRDAGVQLLLHTWACDAIVGDGAVRGIVVESKSGRQALPGRVVIDATGDADVCARAGASFWQTRHDEDVRLTDSLMYRIEFGARRPSGSYRCDFGTNAVVWGRGWGRSTPRMPRSCLKRSSTPACACMMISLRSRLSIRNWPTLAWSRLPRCWEYARAGSWRGSTNSRPKTLSKGAASPTWWP